MYSLGMIHATGTGTSRNCELAAGLFKNVAERGSWAKLFSMACVSQFASVHLHLFCA